MVASPSTGRNSFLAAAPTAATAATAAASSWSPAKASIASTALAHRKQWKAAAGGNGSGDNCHGASAADLVIAVPPGTVVIDAAARPFVLRDLAAAGEQLVVAQGGKGGKGNVRFKSATNRAPRQFTSGEPGESRLVRLELKMIADVGLVGKPNAGKSTCSAGCRARRPEIAPYPFTTKHPNLGRVQIDADRAFIMADIPGLIEGASAGAGLGHEFLRHIERTGILVHLLEPEPADGTDPLTNYHAIHGELGQYSESLAARDELVVVTKADLPAAEAVRRQVADALGREVLLVSAVTGQGLNQLVAAITKMLHKPADKW